MRVAAAQHVVHRGAQVVAHVVGQQRQHVRLVGARHESRLLERHGIDVGVARHQLEPAQLGQQRARMHVARHRLRQRLETGRVAGAWQGQRTALALIQRVGHPAHQHLACQAVRCGQRGLIAGLEQPADLAPRQARGGAHAADQPMARNIGVQAPRLAHQRGAQQLVQRRVRQTARQRQPRQRRQQLVHGRQQDGLIKGLRHDCDYAIKCAICTFIPHCCNANVAVTWRDREPPAMKRTSS